MFAKQAHPADVAAIILEPIMGEGGMLTPPPGARRLVLGSFARGVGSLQNACSLLPPSPSHVIPKGLLCRPSRLTPWLPCRSAPSLSCTRLHGVAARAVRQARHTPDCGRGGAAGGWAAAELEAHEACVSSPVSASAPNLHPSSC
jgi:hypothetical protein